METKMLVKNDPLWKRIQAFSLDASNVDFPFSKKLAAEENWTSDFTNTAIEEYKKFVYLCCISPYGASPSEIVDKVWHMHLLYTENYWEEFCPNILQRKLHHHPSKGGFEEKSKHEEWFFKTLKNYRDIFQQQIPEEIWINAHYKPCKSKEFSLKNIKLILFLMALMLVSSCLGEILSSVMGIMLLLAGISIVGYVISLFRKHDPNKDKNNGGSSGSYSDGGMSCSGGESSCSSSCGGGCGGCGGD